MTGLSKLDESTGGLFPGELVVLAARPSVGKTSLACQIAHHVATRRLVYFASLEMGDRELTTKLICSLGGVSSKRVRTGKLEQRDLQALIQGGNELSQAKLLIHDRASLSVQDIARACRNLAKQGLAFAVADYLGLIAVPDRRGKRYEQVGEIVKGLKAIARELRIPVLVLCQLNRATESTGKPQRPRLHNLRESGDIEQTADVVLLLHREEPDRPGERVTKTLLDVAKNRNSETGGLWLEWNAERTRYDDAKPANYETAFDEFSGNSEEWR
jgi:replicative DNA helicase